MLASLGRGTGSRSGIGCMKIAILKERRAHETRVAVSPDTVKRFVDMGVEVAVEKGAGDGASIPDQAFQAAGAVIAATAAAALKGADLRSEEHTSELQSLMRISYAVFCLKKKKQKRCKTRQITNYTLIKQQSTK